MAFGLGKKDTDYSVIIDVHSGSVGIAIMYAPTSTENPELIFTHREYIKIIEYPNTENLVRAIRNALFSAVLQFSQEGTKLLQEHNAYAKIGKTLLVCGAPWAQTATRFIRVEDKEPFLITEEKIRSLIQETERRDETELQTTALLKELNVSLVEHAVVHTAINGYPVHNPYGKKGKELTLSHISGLVPKAIIEAVRDIEDKVLMHVPRITHTFALVLFCVLRDMHPEIKHAITVDISGEATEICIIQDEVLMETYVFPYGTHTFLRDVALKLNTFPDEALTHIRENNDSAPEAVRGAIDEVSALYVAQLTEAYTSLNARYVIPKHLFLTTSRALDVFFDPLVQKASEKYIGNHGAFISMNTAMIPPSKDGSVDSKDIFFLLEARFFHKMHTCGEIT